MMNVVDSNEGELFEVYLLYIVCIDGFIWEENFNKNCQDLNMYYEWVHDIQEEVKINGKKLPFKQFIDQYNELRIINQV